MAHLVGYRVPQDLRMAGNALLCILVDAWVKDSGIDPALSQSHAEGSFRKVRWYLGNDPHSKPARRTGLDADRIGLGFQYGQGAVEPRNGDARLAEDPSGVLFCCRQ